MTAWTSARRRRDSSPGRTATAAKSSPAMRQAGGCAGGISTIRISPTDEPQYERLDELMRWSGALDWLRTAGGGVELPQLKDGRIRSDLRFKDWYADHDELRERRHIEFVAPPSADGEALQNAASRTFKECGRLKIEGGVSLADRVVSGEDTARPHLPRGMRRAGEFEPGQRSTARPGQGGSNRSGRTTSGGSPTRSGTASAAVRTAAPSSPPRAGPGRTTSSAA